MGDSQQTQYMQINKVVGENEKCVFYGENQTAFLASPIVYLLDCEFPEGRDCTLPAFPGPGIISRATFPNVSDLSSSTQKSELSLTLTLTFHSRHSQCTPISLRSYHCTVLHSTFNSQLFHLCFRRIFLSP